MLETSKQERLLAKNGNQLKSTVENQPNLKNIYGSRKVTAKHRRNFEIILNYIIMSLNKYIF